MKQTPNSVVYIQLAIIIIATLLAILFLPTVAHSGNVAEEYYTRRKLQQRSATQASVSYESRQTIPREAERATQATTNSSRWVMSLEDYARMQARGAGIDEDMFVRIGNCEGGLDGKLRINSTDHVGPYQFNRKTFRGAANRMGWPEADVENILHNIEVAAWKMAHDGTGEWVCR